MWFFTRKTAEEKRLNAHTKAMGRVKRDIVIKPVPYVTRETLEQAVAREYLCRECNAEVPVRLGLCADCKLQDSAMLMDEATDRKSGLGGKCEMGYPEIIHRIPSGIVVDPEGNWIHDPSTYPPKVRTERALSTII